MTLEHIFAKSLKCLVIFMLQKSAPCIVHNEKDSALYLSLVNMWKWWHKGTAQNVKLPANEKHHYYSRSVGMQLTSATIQPSRRCSHRQGCFPLFLCHGSGRVSERTHTNNSCDLH